MAVSATPEGPPHRLFVVQEGPSDAPDLLLLHGFPTSSWDWVWVWPELTRRFRCLAVDFLGFGFSDKPHPHSYSIFEQANLVCALLDERGIVTVDVLAHDYGDTVAQELIARDQKAGSPRLRSVSFLNGGLFPETHRIRPIQRWLRTPIGPFLARHFGRASFYASFPKVFAPATRPDRKELDAFWSTISTHDGPRVFPSLVGYIAERRRHRARWVDAVMEPPYPIQIINGSLDPVSGAHMVARFRQLGGIAAIEELSRVGHYPQVESPQRVLELFFAWHDAIAAGM